MSQFQPVELTGPRVFANPQLEPLYQEGKVVLPQAVVGVGQGIDYGQIAGAAANAVENVVGLWQDHEQNKKITALTKLAETAKTDTDNAVRVGDWDTATKAREQYRQGAKAILGYDPDEDITPFGQFSSRAMTSVRGTLADMDTMVGSARFEFEEDSKMEDLAKTDITVRSELLKLPPEKRPEYLSNWIATMEMSSSLEESLARTPADKKRVLGYKKLAIDYAEMLEKMGSDPEALDERLSRMARPNFAAAEANGDVGLKLLSEVDEEEKGFNYNSENYPPALVEKAHLSTRYLKAAEDGYHKTAGALIATLKEIGVVDLEGIDPTDPVFLPAVAPYLKSEAFTALKNARERVVEARSKSAAIGRAIAVEKLVGDKAKESIGSMVTGYRTKAEEISLGVRDGKLSLEQGRAQLVDLLAKYKTEAVGKLRGYLPSETAQTIGEFDLTTAFEVVTANSRGNERFLGAFKEAKEGLLSMTNAAGQALGVDGEAAGGGKEGMENTAKFAAFRESLVDGTSTRTIGTLSSREQRYAILEGIGFNAGSFVINPDGTIKGYKEVREMLLKARESGTQPGGITTAGLMLTPYFTDIVKDFQDKMSAAKPEEKEKVLAEFASTISLFAPGGNSVDRNVVVNEPEINTEGFDLAVKFLMQTEYDPTGIYMLALGMSRDNQNRLANVLESTLQNQTNLDSLDAQIIQDRVESIRILASKWSQSAGINAVDFVMNASTELPGLVSDEGFVRRANDLSERWSGLSDSAKKDFKKNEGDIADVVAHVNEASVINAVLGNLTFNNASDESVMASYKRHIGTAGSERTKLVQLIRPMLVRALVEAKRNNPAMSMTDRDALSMATQYINNRLAYRDYNGAGGFSEPRKDNRGEAVAPVKETPQVLLSNVRATVPNNPDLPLLVSDPLGSLSMGVTNLSDNTDARLVASQYIEADPQSYVAIMREATASGNPHAFIAAVSAFGRKPNPTLSRLFGNNTKTMLDAIGTALGDTPKDHAGMIASIAAIKTVPPDVDTQAEFTRYLEDTSRDIRQSILSGDGRYKLEREQRRGHAASGPRFSFTLYSNGKRLVTLQPNLKSAVVDVSQNEHVQQNILKLTSRDVAEYVQKNVGKDSFGVWAGGTFYGSSHTTKQESASDRNSIDLAYAWLANQPDGTSITVAQSGSEEVWDWKKGILSIGRMNNGRRAILYHEREGTRGTTFGIGDKVVVKLLPPGKVGGYKTASKTPELGAAQELQNFVDRLVDSYQPPVFDFYRKSQPLPEEPFQVAPSEPTWSVLQRDINKIVADFESQNSRQTSDYMQDFMDETVRRFDETGRNIGGPVETPSENYVEATMPKEVLDFSKGLTDYSTEVTRGMDSTLAGLVGLPFTGKDLGTKSDLRPKEKSKPKEKKTATVDGFVFEALDKPVTIREVYEQVYGVEKGRERLRKANWFIQRNADELKQFIALPNYLDRTPTEVFETDLSLTARGFYIPERDEIYLAKNKQDTTLLHETTHSTQGVARGFVSSAVSAAMNRQLTDNERYVLSNVEIPAWVASLKAQYFIDTGIELMPETPTKYYDEFINWIESKENADKTFTDPLAEFLRKSKSGITILRSVASAAGGSKDRMA